MAKDVVSELLGILFGEKRFPTRMVQSLIITAVAFATMNEILQIIERGLKVMVLIQITFFAILIIFAIDEIKNGNK
ncbi:hypothetical protein CMI37_30135 [Candidatus Pacearchaeota archaeon]|nr:hypothetical protein [Candidatus Pacearchaeota archaeon]|tara:strand:+ start:18426 stop:18653 length:228 start_codon:yes stop_codon:yes gene_type:complete